MEGWKGKLISREGRLQLVKSVISAILIYFMMCFKLPQWVIDRIDVIRRGFLWGKNDKESRPISLICWSTVCFPVQNGGMGLHDLALHNTALLLRWWWRTHANRASLWSTTIPSLKGTGFNANGPCFWMVADSFFWRALRRLLLIFRWCTTWVIGNGSAIPFWFNAWNGRPLIEIMEQGVRPTQPKISLRDAQPIAQVLLLDQDLTITLNTEMDQTVRRWTSNGSYSASSTNKMMITVEKLKFAPSYIWKLRIPPMVRIFAYCLIKDKILTGDVMVRRHMGSDNFCLMCQNCPAESALHLIFIYLNAVQVWFGLSKYFGFRVMIPTMTIGEIVKRSREQSQMQGEGCKKIWNSLFMCACWMLWKQRNERIFSGKLVPVQIILDRVIAKTELWIQCCNAGSTSIDHNLLEESD